MNTLSQQMSALAAAERRLASQWGRAIDMPDGLAREYLMARLADDAARQDRQAQAIARRRQFFVVIGGAYLRPGA